MPKIESIRTLLLSSPYADADEPEIQCNFPNGPQRTIGMVEITLDNGVTGLGEGYLAVFAPHVFESLVELCRPHLEGQDAFAIDQRVKDLCQVCDYWSLQGAARHAISALEIALVDAKAKSREVPAWKLFAKAAPESIRIYGSGGCCETKEHFRRELDLLVSHGIDLYKIRAAKEDVQRSIWILNEAASRGIEVAVDMCQNLASPPQTADDVMGYLEQVYAKTKNRIAFLEEALGPMDVNGFKVLRDQAGSQICGGEIITTPTEMNARIGEGVYNFVQPDASVIGGINAVMDVFTTAQKYSCDVVVHAWGGPVAQMANYHAAFAGEGPLVEFPMLAFPLRETMAGDQIRIEAGRLLRPTAAGIGVILPAQVESRYPFDESAVYSCRGRDYDTPPEMYWT